MNYVAEDVPLILKQYDPFNVRTWPYYPITMPSQNGKGPVAYAECDEITWEVWDIYYNSYGTHTYLPDAINQALQLTNELLA